MNIRKSINLVEVVTDEIALEGLDGITLEALWQRLAIRLGETLPLKDAFMEQIWIMCLELHDLSFYELENPRESLVIFDRYELEYLNADTDKEFEHKDIYLHCPVEDTKLGVRGSCLTYNTRKNISSLVKNLTLSEINDKYRQKLVIVASQSLRESALVDDNVSSTIQLPLIHYCLLERIGRARTIGEITIKKSANIKEDAKALFYIRKVLQDLGLIRKQVYYQASCGTNYNGQNTGTLVHLTRFFNTRKPKVIMWAEHLINYLKSKENYVAEYNEVKKELNIDYSIKKFFKINMLQKVFKTNIKVPYRSYYPNSVDKEWQTKSNAAKERVVRLISLGDPNIEINDLWRSEEVKEDDDNDSQLDIRSQKLSVPFLKQIYSAVEAREFKGASQSELGNILGFTKLLSRTLVRNLVKAKIVYTYLDDVGRQRTTKFVSRKFEGKSSVEKQLEVEISKIKEYGRTMQNESIKANASTVAEEVKMVECSDLNLKKEKIDESLNHDVDTTELKECSSQKENSDNEEEKIIHTEYYKTIEVELIAQKPECKKKSQKVAVVGFLENVHNSENNKQSNLSVRLLKRANLVIQSVKENKIEDLQKLTKYISTEEDKAGLDAKIDKNSLMRLLQKLAEDNLIKYIKLILRTKDHSKKKDIHFICDPSIDEDNSVLQSAVEKAKLKFCMQEISCETMSASNNQLGRKYGYTPKFIRMKEMHLFLYHLIYDHPGHCVSKNLLLENINDEEYSSDIIDLITTSNVYTSEISWKMFIPPLPHHKGYSEGWALLCDVLLRMPLSIFVKVHNVKYAVPGLQQLLDHPIKRHMLVKDLDVDSMLNILFAKRKYIFDIHFILQKLCCIGIVQFGPVVLNEKDQIFIYLNRRSELLDTTSSASGYYHIEDKPYPVSKYEFDSMAVIEKYWYEMWNICVNTCLGCRSIVQGEDVVQEDLMRKPEMLQALKSRAPEEAEKYDTGFVPGDRNGAAGIDAAFYAHLNSNWNWITKEHNDKKENQPLPAKPKPAPTTKPISKLMAARKSFPPKKRSIPLKQNQVKASSSSKASDPTQAKGPAKLKRDKGQLFPVVSCRKSCKKVRKVLPRKPMRKKVKYDEVDFGALQLMGKLRVDWQQHEDNILLVCKVAMVYLCPNPRRNRISFTAIRDILHSYSFTSYNKTSRACQRRLLYMLKQPKTVNSVLVGVEEVKQDYYINKRFGSIVDSARGESEDSLEYEQRVERIFKELVAYIAKKYYDISNMEQRESVALPKTIQEFNIFHKLMLPTKIIASPGVSTEVREVNDIHTATINSVIHSSMCCGKERRSWAYQLFKVYQQYPEYLLRSAMLKIRADQMVTMKKNYMNAYKKFGNCMPMSSSQYQLSSAYYYKFQTKWPYEVFSETYNVLFSLMKNYAEKVQTNSTEGMEMKPGLGGVVAAMHDFVGTDNLDIDIEIPDQIIMLDPGLPEKGEVYQRIALRYQAILEGLNSDYSESLREAQNNFITQADLMGDSESINIIEEEQSLVQIRPEKRPLEHEDCSPQMAKRQKLDSESKESGDGSSNEDVLPVIDCTLEGGQLLTKFATTGEPASTSVPTLSIQDSTDNNKLGAENAIEKATGNGDDKKNETPVERMECVDGTGKDADINIQTFSCESLIADNNKIHKELVQPFTHFLDPANTIISSGSIGPLPNSYSRVSTLMKRTGNREPIEGAGTRTEVHDVRTRQTRIAMLKMREELHDLTFHDSQHAHEYFVVNPFKLLYSLMASKEDRLNVVAYRGLELPRRLLPIDVEMANKVLEDVKKFAVFPKGTISYDDLKKEILEDKLFDWDDVNGIYKFIKTKTEFGATLHELVTNFTYIGDKLADILSLLSDKRIVLRAGIITVRYIHYRYVNPWIIHSYKILRLEKESHQTIPEGSVYVLDNEDSINDTNSGSNRVATAANLFYNSSVVSTTSEDVNNKSSEQKPSEDSVEKRTDEITAEPKDIEQSTNNDVSNETSNLHVDKSDETPAKSADDTEESPTNQRRLHRNRTVLLKQKDIYRAAKLLDFNTAEEIKVVIKPWIRIDGVVNRRVLDRMLGAVLCYCIEKPGISLTMVQNRFTPAIQPYHTRELIEILVKLACVKTSVQRVSKVTLFSKPAELDLNGNPDLVADSNTVIIEATVEATSRFGMFLSNRSYSSDFLSSF